MPSICRALDVLPLRPGRGAEASSRVAQGAPKRHKPDAAKGAAPRGHVEPIGPGNSKRAPAKRRRDAQQEADPPAEEGAAPAHPSISACLRAWPWHLRYSVALLGLILGAFAPVGIHAPPYRPKLMGVAPYTGKPGGKGAKRKRLTKAEKAKAAAAESAANPAGMGNSNASARAPESGATLRPSQLGCCSSPQQGWSV